MRATGQDVLQFIYLLDNPLVNCVPEVALYEKLM